MVQGGHYNPKEKKVEGSIPSNDKADTAVADPDMKFASRLYGVIQEHILQWATGEGSFVVVALLEALSGKEKEGLIKDLKSHKKLINERAASNKGTKLILETMA